MLRSILRLVVFLFMLSPLSVGFAIETLPRAVEAICEEGRDAGGVSVTLVGGFGNVAYRVTQRADWFRVSPSDSTFFIKGNVVVTFPQASRMRPGVYEDTFKIQAPATRPYEVEVPVRLTVRPSERRGGDRDREREGWGRGDHGRNRGELRMSPERHEKTIEEHSPAFPLATDIWLDNADRGGDARFNVSADASWLEVSPSNGTLTSRRTPIRATAYSSGMEPGVYRAKITISASGVGGSPRVVPVTLNVKPRRPQAKIEVSLLRGIARSARPFEQLSPDTFDLWNSAGRGEAPMAYRVRADQDWMRVSPSEGRTPQGGGPTKIAIQYNTSRLSPGMHSGKIIITSPDADNSPRFIPVQIEVFRPHTMHR